MAAKYVHVEVETAQTAKKPGAPCGDVVICQRTIDGATLCVIDGVGSGIRAHIAAEMCGSRLLELLRLGFSLHKAVDAIVHTMERDHDPSRPLCAFSAARVRSDGQATILSYEAPLPVLISRGQASSLLPRPLQLGGAMVQETSCFLEPDDGLMLVSDGITQAGLGSGLPQGWQLEGAVRWINDCLAAGILLRELPQRIEREARKLWKQGGDDTTIALALCRRGEIVNILTGPPIERDQDVKIVRKFAAAEGLKIVCGGTTAEVVARALRRTVEIEQNPTSLVAPPRYRIEGIDLVTEGAVTLNQVYNLLDEDIRNLTEDSGVTDLCSLLMVADRVNILSGRARNSGHADISFRQRGILSRHRVVPLLAEKLRADGKLVIVEEV